ncbi:UNVERIFIED_ORG: hypothetical protein FHR35_003069 [Microbispora rosea subsp. rosea]
MRNLSFTTARLPEPSRVRARPVTRVGGGAPGRFGRAPRRLRCGSRRPAAAGEVRVRPADHRYPHHRYALTLERPTPETLRPQR